MWYGEIWSEADMTQLSLMLYFSKTDRNFFTILLLNIVDKNPFQMSLGSHLAALVWQTGVHTNVARNKDVIWRNLVRSLHDTTTFDVIFFKNGSKFFTILSLNIVDNIPFQMSLGSHLAALVWQTGVHTNVARNKHVIWRNLVRSWHDTTKFDVIFSKTARNFFTILSLNIVDNIPFQMSLGSHLAALVLTDWRSYKRSKK